jgi:hypothetical protein
LQSTALNGQDHRVESNDGRSRWLSPGNHLHNDKYRNMYAQSKEHERPGQAAGIS